MCPVRGVREVGQGLGIFAQPSPRSPERNVDCLSRPRRHSASKRLKTEIDHSMCFGSREGPHP